MAYFPKESSHICFSHAFLSSLFLSSVTSFFFFLFVLSVHLYLLFSFYLLSINRLILTRSFIFKSLSSYLLFSIARRETSTLKDHEIAVVVIVVVLFALLIYALLLFSIGAGETSTSIVIVIVTVTSSGAVITLVTCRYVVFPSHF